MGPDFSIGVDFEDLKSAAITLREFEKQWADMVNGVVREQNKIERAYKASNKGIEVDANAVVSAIKKAHQDATAAIVAEQRKQEAAIRRTQLSLNETVRRATGVIRDSATENGAGTYGDGGSATEQRMDELGRKYNEVYRASMEYAEGVQELEEALRYEVITIEQYYSALEKLQSGMTGTIQSTKQLADSLRLIDVDAVNRATGVNGDRAINNGAGYSAIEGHLEELKQKYAPLTVAAERYAQIQRDLKVAELNGIITEEEHAKKLEQVTQQYNRLVQSGELAKGMTNQFGDIARIGGLRVSNLGMYAQQAGYQVADFAVQVQMGTSYLVALGQQGSQFLAIFGHWGAIAGAVLAIGAAFAYAYEKMSAAKEEGVDADKVFKGLGEKLKDLEHINLAEQTSDFADGAERAAGAFDRILQVMEEVRLNDVKKIIDEPRQNILQSLRDYHFQQDMRGRFGSDAPEYNFMGFNNENDASFVATQFSTLTGKTTEELQKQLAAVTEALELRGVLNDQVKETLTALAEELGIVEDINDTTKEQAKHQEEVSQAAQRAKDFLWEQQRAMYENVRLQEVANEFGKSSVQYHLEEQEIARENLIVAARRAGVDQAGIEAILAQYDAQNKVLNAGLGTSEAFQTILNAAEDIAGVDMSGMVWDAVTAGESFYNRMVSVLGVINGILSAIGQIQFDTIALEAENKALAAGANAAEANVAGQNAVFSQRMDNQFGTSGWGGILGNLLTAGYEHVNNERLDAQNENDRLMDALRQRERDAKKTGGSGGSHTKKTDEEKAAEKVQKVLDDIKLEIEQKERLLGLNEQQRREAEAYAAIESKLGENRKLVSEETINSLVKEQLAIEDLMNKQEEVEQRRKAMIDSMESNLSNAFMAIVDGSASVNDAFRDMLRQMILDIYKSQVVEPYTDYAGDFLRNAFGFLTSANGNVFGPSGHISYFAKGDVFSSPTAFSFGGGQMGVMGEAGPEAVMPLKRGPDGKLGVTMNSGSQGNTTVVQNFHFSANGDDSVKRIIRGEMPRIAEAAKGAVLEAQKRNSGGFRR